jgi:tetratricopeptide (TPR) repeat protein
VFGQAGGFAFVNYDDPRNVSANARVAAGLSWKGMAWAFTHSQLGRWAPLVTISHMADCQFFGLRAGGHHLTNVALHAAAAILLFLAMREMTGALWRSAFVAAVFAVHPLRAEVVAWVSARGDVLGGVFFMLALWAYVRYARGAPSFVRNLPVAVLFALGLMCKPTIVTLPCVLLLLDCWPLGRFKEKSDSRLVFSIPRHLIVEKIPLFALSACSCVATVLAQEKSFGIINKVSLVDRTGNTLVSYAAYLWEMVCPAGLTILYPHPANHLPVWKALLSLLLLAAISAGAFAWRRSRPYLLVGWLWYLGMLVPMIGLIQIGWQAHADRYTYLPQIGLYIAITWLVANFCAARRWLRVMAGTAAAIAVAVLMWGTWIQASYWRNSESLWTRSLDLAGNAVTENGFGTALIENGRLDEGIAHYQKALEINPGSAEAHYNLGNALVQKGQADEAIAHFQKALDLEPDLADAHNNLGTVLQQRGRLDEAMIHFQKTLEIDPDYAEAHSNLGYILHLRGNVDEAIAHYQSALEINPGLLETRLNLGIAFGQKGEMNAALAQFQQAVKINPGSAKAQNDLGLALLQGGKVEESIGHFQKALEIEPGYADARNNLNLALQQRNQ